MKYIIDISDKRNNYLYALMTERGYKVSPLTDKRELNCAYIFSPAKKFTVDEISVLPYGIILYCGNIEPKIKKIADEKGIKHINFLDSREFALENAKLTAEGVLALLIEKTPRSMFDMRILLMGYGRCGKAISELFIKLGLDFTVAVREAIKEENAIIKSIAFDDQFSIVLSEFDVIINTIPAKMIDDEYISRIDNEAVVIEVASLPCLSREKADFTYITAPGLPTVFTPESAALLILKEIENEYIK